MGRPRGSMFDEFRDDFIRLWKEGKNYLEIFDELNLGGAGYSVDSMRVYLMRDPEISKVREEYPHVKISIYAQYHDQIQKMIDNGMGDIEIYRALGELTSKSTFRSYLKYYFKPNGKVYHLPYYGEGTKTCCRCGQEKSINDFQYLKNTKRFHSWCRVCKADYYKNNRERLERKCQI